MFTARLTFPRQNKALGYRAPHWINIRLGIQETRFDFPNLVDRLRLAVAVIPAAREFDLTSGHQVGF